MLSSSFLLQKGGDNGTSLGAVMRIRLDVAHIALRAGPDNVKAHSFWFIVFTVVGRVEGPCV